MNKINAGDSQSKSADLTKEKVDQLRALVPEAFTEGKVDFDVLKQLLGGVVDEREEKYGLNWHGKRQARQLALTPSTGTLRPCPADSVNWDTTQNLMIEGDNLEVLKLLQKSYAGKVKLIYIDPPYNTGKDFVYPDNFQDSIKNYLEMTGQVQAGQKIHSNTESSGRFHTDWLNMMYPRLKLAANLLSRDGAILVTIDDGECANLIQLMNEVFGEENFVALVAWHKRVSPANDAKWFSSDLDHVLVYAKNKEHWRPQRLARTEQQIENYKNPDNDPRGPWNSATYTCNKTKDERPNLYYPIKSPAGRKIWPKETAVWRYAADVTEQLVADNRLYWGADGEAVFPRVKLFLSEMGGVVPRTLWSPEDVGHTQEATAELKDLFDGAQVFDSPKPVRLIERMLELTCSAPGDIALDFFAGSGTTGHAVMRRNAASGSCIRFILVQLPEPTDDKYKSIAGITRERLRRAAKEVRSEHKGYEGDLGFRTFRLDSSNLRSWEPTRDNLVKSLADAMEHIKGDRSEEDILFELLLKLGLEPTAQIETKQIASKAVHSIGAGTLIVCLAEKVTGQEVEPLAQGIVAWHEKLAPAGETQVVFRDSAFADDVAKTNLTAILQQHGLDNVRSL